MLLKEDEIAKEADFYGSMDGASKFVKGDAIASILILAINIIGGLIIGITQYDLPVATAAENYVLLSIGDGLVAQIPSLLLAISTAIIVTRVSDKQDMTEHIGEQLSISKAWIPVSAVLLLIGLFPECQIYFLFWRQLSLPPPVMSLVVLKTQRNTIF